MSNWFKLSLPWAFTIDFLELNQSLGSSESAPCRRSLMAVITKPLQFNTNGWNRLSNVLPSPILGSNREFVLAVLKRFVPRPPVYSFSVCCARGRWPQFVFFATRASAIQGNGGCTPPNTSAEPSECGCAVSLLAPCTLWIRRWSGAGGSRKQHATFGAETVARTSRKS